jgi:hypothetical protein
MLAATGGVAGPDQCDQCDHQCQSVTLAGSPNKDCYNGAFGAQTRSILLEQYLSSLEYL